MTTGSTETALGGARQGATTVARRPEFRWLARVGLVARGIVYGVIGFLALKLALGAGGKTTSQTGAFQTIAHEPFGEVLLLVVCVGLACYAIWRLVAGIVGSGPPNDRSTMGRVSAIASGLAYSALFVTAVKILVGAGSSSSTTNPKHDAAGVLGWPGGPEIVGLGGAILIGVAGFQAYKGISRKFLEDSSTERMSPSVERGFTALGVFGHLARAVVFALIGYGLVKAAVAYAPHNAIGLDGALQKLSRASYGPLLLGIVAAGLVGFALYSIVDARYRRV